MKNDLTIGTSVLFLVVLAAFIFVGIMAAKINQDNENEDL